MKRPLAMLLALALLLLCACSAAPEPTQPAAEPPVETAETLPDHAAQDDAASEPAQPLFWQVSGNGYSGSFYLLGSIHVSDGLTYPQELLDAYAACDTLAVESDVLALEADLSAQVEMMRCLVYTDGTTIDAHLDAQTYADAKQVLTDLGGYQTMLDHYMPIFWYLLAGNLALAQTRFSPDGGVDRYFLQMAKADGTEILEVEQYTDVYRALGALSEETQVYALQQAIRPEVLAATEEDAAALLDAWCSGDEAAIIDLLEAEPDEPLTPEEEAAAEEFGRTLVTDRNAVMIRAADEALRAREERVLYRRDRPYAGRGRHCRRAPPARLYRHAGIICKLNFISSGPLRCSGPLFFTLPKGRRRGGRCSSPGPGAAAACGTPSAACAARAAAGRPHPA